MGRLDGKVAVITGAGGGMGREATLLFTQEGAKVCAADAGYGRQPAESAEKATMSVKYLAIRMGGI